MSFLRRFLAEPLVQFLLIGVAVFGFYTAIDRSPAQADRQVIEVGPGRVAQLFETFSRTWQRPPTPEELNGLVEAFVQEEIFYREGTKMGLDRDDTVFRRRMQQKMEFLMEPGEAELDPSEAELRAYLKDNAEGFRVPARLAFRQIFLDPSKRGEGVQQDAEALLAALEVDEGGPDPADAGDPTLLPHTVRLIRADQIESDFGRQFVEELSRAEAGRWVGPIRSTYGLHLVFIDERAPARDPELDEVRDVVLREWQAGKRRRIAEERYREMRANYEVIVTPPGEETTSATPEPGKSE